MKKYISIILAALCIFLIVGCSKSEQGVPDTPNTMVPSIIYEGDLYRTTGKEIPAEVDESAIVGEISSIVPLTQLPTKEGEANFGQIGDQFAVTSNGLLVKMNHEWVVFELSEAEITGGAPLAPPETNMDLDSVSHIEVMSGLTGQKITVKDTDHVQKVMDDIESLKYEKKNAVEEVGYAYRIRFYDENYDELGRIFITEENGHQISYDGYYYFVEADQNINVDYLEELLKDAPPAEPGDEGNDELPDIESMESEETVIFHENVFYKSDLSRETIEWLDWYNSLSEAEQLAISYIPSDLYEICGYPTAEDMVVEETIIYNGKEYKTSELCNDTLYWLGLSEQERMFSSYLPPEFMEFEENYGIKLSLENITATGATIKCEQSGGEATGELETGSWYIVERWTQIDGWKEVETVIDKRQVGWTSEAYMILEDSTSEWEVNWEWLYGELPAGKYRIGKQITDWRAPGDYDTVLYYAEFELRD